MLLMERIDAPAETIHDVFSGVRQPDGSWHVRRWDNSSATRVYSDAEKCRNFRDLDAIRMSDLTRTWRPGLFHLVDRSAWPGWTCGEMWNGFVVVKFSRDVAEAILESGDLETVCIRDPVAGPRGLRARYLVDPAVYDDGRLHRTVENGAVNHILMWRLAPSVCWLEVPLAPGVRVGFSR